MGLIVQEKALQVAAGMRELLALVRKHDKALFEQMRRAMSSVVLNLAEADGNDGGTARARFASACGSAKEVRAGIQLALAYGYVPSRKALGSLGPSAQSPGDGAELIEPRIEL